MIDENEPFYFLHKDTTKGRYQDQDLFLDRQQVTQSSSNISNKVARGP